jgi:hypothetical protein
VWRAQTGLRQVRHGPPARHDDADPPRRRRGTRGGHRGPVGAPEDARRVGHARRHGRRPRLSHGPGDGDMAPGRPRRARIGGRKGIQTREDHEVGITRGGDQRADERCARCRDERVRSALRQGHTLLQRVGANWTPKRAARWARQARSGGARHLGAVPGVQPQMLGAPRRRKSGFRESPTPRRRSEARQGAEGYALLLQLVFEELATELPGLYGPAGVADLVPIPAATCATWWTPSTTPRSRAAGPTT